MFTPRGAFTALVTPFTHDGEEVDHARLRDAVQRQAAAGMAGVVPCGTTGETPTLSAAEYRAVIETVADAARHEGIACIPGAGSNCTRHAVELHRFAHSCGAQAALHVNPYYNRPSQEGLYRHFMEIADSAPLPVILYNIPGRTGVLMHLETVTRLARHPNVTAIKDATGGLDLAARIVCETPLAVLSGDDPLALATIALGGRGVISVLGNLLPERVVALVREGLADRWDEARAIHHEILPLARAMLELDSNPVPVKTALFMHGLDSGSVRLPLCSMPEPAREYLAKLLPTSLPTSSAALHA